MKPGDLVHIKADYLRPGEPIIGLILRRTNLVEDGDQIAGELDWWIFWGESEVPFPESDLEVINETR